MYPLLNELRSRSGLRTGTGAREQGYQWRRNENLMGKVAKEEMSSEMEEGSLTSRITKT